MNKLDEHPEYAAEVEKARVLKRTVNELDVRIADVRDKLRPIRSDSSNSDKVAHALAIARGGDQEQTASTVDLQRLEAQHAALLRGIAAQEQIITDTERRLSDRAAKALAPKLREIIAKQHRAAQALALQCSLEDELRAEYERAGYRGTRLPRVGIFTAGEARDFDARTKRYVAEAEEQLRLNGLVPQEKSKVA